MKTDSELPADSGIAFLELSSRPRQKLYEVEMDNEFVNDAANLGKNGVFLE